MKKMNKIKYIFLSAFAALTLNSCDSLDIENTTSYDANLVWNDDALATAYVTNLYANVFDNWSCSADYASEQVHGMPFYDTSITLTSGNFKKFDYTTIRLINEAIAKIEAGGLDQSVKDELLGQVYFMRAYVYSDMVFYHGGIPYITVPQDKDKDDLYVSRNTTAECFDYLIADLDKAISMLPEKVSGASSEYGRIDQCFAKAYKAKVLLYKASPQFNPKSMYTNSHWQEAYEAAKTAYEFCVNKGAALTPSYSDIWLQEKGDEVVFAVVNSYPNKVAYWDYYIRPGSLSRSTAQNPPTWNLVKAFPMLDGKTYNDPTGKYYVGTEADLLQRFWKNRDPRFASSILYNGDLYPVQGTKSGYRQYTALGIADQDDSYGTNPKAGVNATNNDFNTGFFVRKGSDLSLSQDLVATYSIDYILMRFAEVMLTYAETANETGHQDVALEMLKQIRKRAGLEAGSDNMYGIAGTDRETLRKAILDERNIEFCFEGHRFMDLRRTRNMMKLNGLEKFGVEAIAINVDGTDMNLNEAKEKAAKFELKPENFRYKLQQVPLSKNSEKQFLVKESYYFFPIQQSKIDENQNLQQNIDWGGTFNPALE
nr:RagB/SusD family nutrient uptake outer membrane protein [uncultured Macellibacteroides sp.]